MSGLTTTSATRQSKSRLTAAINHRVALLARRLDLPLLDERQLLSREQILRGKHYTTPCGQKKQTTQAEEGAASGCEGVSHGGEEAQHSWHERSGSHVPDVKRDSGLGFAQN